MPAPLEDLERLPTLQTERLTLRAPAWEDLDALHQIFSDAEVMRYWSSPPHGDRERTREMLVAIGRGFEDRTVLQWAIERDDDRRVLGTVTLMPAPGGQPRAEFGYILGRAHWGQGYAFEAQRRLIAFAFEDLALHRLEADVHRENAASVRSLERLGFRHEGTLRERWIVEGTPSDSLIFGLLAAEWRRK
jgi:[ribosomal protein S5]-alanine N-acetyltransferase